MFTWAKIISGLVDFANAIMNMIHEQQLVQTGKDLQKGETDAQTLANIQKADAARVEVISPAVSKSIDDELCIDKPPNTSSK